MTKLKVTQDYEKLSEDLQEQIKLVYPQGFRDYLISYNNKEGKKVTALRFETDEKIYLIRMTLAQAIDIIESDDDYDDNGSLNEDVKEEYEQKHSDIDYLSENDNYESDDDDRDDDN